MTNKVQVIVFSFDGRAPKILLFKRAKAKAGRGWPNLWQPITGGVEPGESIETAAAREALEEAGIKTPQRIISDVYSFNFKNPPGHRRAGPVTEHVFGYEVSPDFSPTISDEHVGAEWFSIEEAMRLLPEKDQKTALQKLVGILKK